MRWWFLSRVPLIALALLLPPAGGEAAPAPSLDGRAIPVLVEITAPVEGAVGFRVPMAPGEVRRGERVEAELVLPAGEEGRAAGVRVTARPLATRSDGSAETVGVSLTGLGEIAPEELPLELLVALRPPRLADPTRLEPAGSPGEEEPRRDGVRVHTGALIEAVDALLWRGEVARAGSSPPEWWSEAAARFPVGTDPGDLDARIEFVQVAYAEKGRPRRAIRLFQEVAESAAEEGGDAGSAPSDEGRLRAWLRACHEIAHLYEGALQDGARSLGWALQCGAAPLADPVEARQNRIASALAVARAVEGMERRGRTAAAGVGALGLYRLLARDLLLDPDPYGTLLLPQIFLHMGDLELEAGAEDAARGAYRAAVAAAGRLPEAVPSNYKAPGSAARAALRRLSAQGLQLSRVPDGEYRGEAFGYNAPVGVRMRFEHGRCTALHVEDLGDKRPLDAYRVLPERILESQSLEVDAVTGATVTSRAIVSAATEAVFGAVESPAGSGERRAGGTAAGADGGGRGVH